MGATHTGGDGELYVPLSELERFEGTGTDVVTLEAHSSKRAIARWRERDKATSAKIELTTTDLAWPDEAKHLISIAPEFLQALHEAGRTAHRDPDKYAVNRIQVRGKSGQLAATDGKQALIQGGFKFPFADDLLIPAIAAFGSKEIAIERGISIGVADNWLNLVAGPWLFWLAIDREGRFPKLEDAIPRALGTSVLFGEADVRRVLEELPRLPVDKDIDPQPVTLDLGKRPAIRARSGTDDEIVEVPLTETQCQGPDVVVLANRAHFGRALAMGFREFHCANPERPLVATEGDRTYISATLDPKLAVPRPTTIPETTAPTSKRVRLSVQPFAQSDSIPTQRSTSMPRESPSPERNGHASPATGAEGLDPLVEAEALRTVLTEAAAQSMRLVAALKQFRKERRAIVSAFSSLKQFNLG
jgi:hypothetical protein